MKKAFYILFVLTGLTLAQTKITGRVTDEEGVPLISANVSIVNSYDGASTDTTGAFSFVTEEKGNLVLKATYIGFKPSENQITINEQKELKLDIILTEELNSTNMVVISAGYFEASDEKKSIMLKPLDIVTTGAQADIYAALNTLPGSQQVGEQEGLFVRGGDAVETKVFIDELLVNKPFFSSIPDIPSRSRFSPFQFKGTMFSTGGYSAQYGQALSSALILKTEDMPEKTFSAIGVMAAGLSGAHTQKWENTSIGLEMAYYDLGPYFSVHKQRQKYDMEPISGDINFVLRHKTSKTGMLKLFTYYNTSDVKMYIDNINSPQNVDKLGLLNRDMFLNASYRDVFGKWIFFAGTSFNLDKSTIRVNNDVILEKNNVLSGKTVLQHPFLENSTFTVGLEATQLKYDESFNVYGRGLNELQSSGFAEGDVFITKDLAARLGIRFEYSKILKKSNIAPRFSAAYKLSENGQFNFAYGQFFQNPEKDYMFESTNLDFEKAEHFILNYQYLTDEYTFRVEGYYKKYDDLVKGNLTYAKGWDDFTTQTNVPLSNLGKGYAKGIDIFWRDRMTLSLGDYWVSYSYLDTKREYRNYPTLATPPFAAKHTFSIVVKRYIPEISTNIGLQYTHATGRTYFNPNNPEFLSDRTKSYNNLSMNLAYLTSFFGNYTVVFFSIDNIPGFANVYGYRYSADGTKSMPVLPTNLRSAFIGFFINFE